MVHIPTSVNVACHCLPACLFVGCPQVAVHAGPESWPHLQGAFLELAVAAVNGHQEVAAALLLSFPDLVTALGHPESSNIVVPVMLELLHTHLVGTGDVLYDELGSGRQGVLVDVG